jgi:phosphoribosylformylglycinamidine synthase
VAVTVNDYFSTRGEAMAMGERSPIALLNPAASGRMAVAEAITNIVAADITRLATCACPANWMAACGEPGEDAGSLRHGQGGRRGVLSGAGHRIPVGKDSLSMKTAWRDGGPSARCSRRCR